MRFRFNSLRHFCRFRNAWNRLTEGTIFIESAERDDLAQRLYRHVRECEVGFRTVPLVLNAGPDKNSGKFRGHFK